MAQTSDSAVLAAGLQSQDTQSLGYHHLLLFVVWGRNTLENLQSLKGGSTASGLVRDHATNGLVEDARRSAEVERSCSRVSIPKLSHSKVLGNPESLTSAGWVVPGHLAQVGVVLHCSLISVSLIFVIFEPLYHLF
jgi:hypothetical protein